MQKVKEQQAVYVPRRHATEVSNIDAKTSALEVFKKLPDDATYDDMMYELYVLQKIERGYADMQEKRIVTHKEVKRRLQQWLR